MKPKGLLAQLLGTAVGIGGQYFGDFKFSTGKSLFRIHGKIRSRSARRLFGK